MFSSLFTQYKIRKGIHFHERAKLNPEIAQITKIFKKEAFVLNQKSILESDPAQPPLEIDCSLKFYFSL